MEPSLTETWRKYSCEEYFNPSALSDHSTSVYKSIEDARKKVASSLEADADQIYFTSGGTEADNLAVSGVTGGKKGNIITSKVEHPAVYNTIKNLKNKGGGGMKTNAPPQAKLFKNAILKGAPVVADAGGNR